MGNALNFRMFSGLDSASEWSPNIPVEGKNDVNRPHSVQLQELVLQFAVPLFLITALAVQNSRQKRREGDWTRRYQTTFEQMTNASDQQFHDIFKQSELSSESDIGRFRQKLYNYMVELEKDENKKYENLLERVSVYDKGLEDVLDIKCSLFRSRKRREVMEAKLEQQLHTKDADLAAMVFPGLRNVSKYDNKFCGKSKETNGKLRQLYTQNWKLRLELEKHKALLIRIKQAAKPES